MLLDELKEELKNIEPDIETIKKFWQNSPLEKKYTELKEVTTQEDFWQNPQQADILKEFQSVKNSYESYYSFIASVEDFQEMLELFKNDESALQNLSKDIKGLIKQVKKFKITLLLSGPDDDSNCFFNVHSGAGGTESQDWAQMLLRMYLRFCEREGFQTSLLDYQAGEGAGIKSATLFVQGKKAYGLLKGEQGIHRLVRISPYDANKRRHTSFASVSLSPEVPGVAITIDPKDLRIDTYRAGGAGGQHVNKTDSAVRITHILSGIVTQCQSERSQLQNKETAMKMLMAKLVQKQKDDEEAKRSSIEKKKIEWGSQIRSYVLHPYKMVKDHRTELESPQPDLVLDGEIMDFIESFLIIQS